MTISNTTNEISYSVSGDDYAVPFKFFANAELLVLLDDVAQTLGTDYTVTGAGEETGGQVSFVTTPVGTTIRIVRVPPWTQLVNFGAVDEFSSDSFQEVCDRLAIGLINAIRRGGTTHEEFDADDCRIINLEDPEDNQDAATKAWVNAQAIAGTGDVPNPDAADAAARKILMATAASAWNWMVGAVPITEAGDAYKMLMATAADTYDWYATIPLPDAGGDDEDKQLECTGDAWGDWAWRGPLMPNLLINGGMDVWQRNTAFAAPNSDTYCADRWIILSDGNGVVDVYRSTSTPDGGRTSIQIDTVTPNKQFGILQILPNEDAAELIGQKVSLSFFARTEIGQVVNNLRSAVLYWDGTADVVTSDCIATPWPGSGSNPSLVAPNWFYATDCTPTNHALTTSWQRFKLESMTIPPAATNVAVLIWVDDDDCVANDRIHISNVKLERREKASAYVAQKPVDELARCQRFYHKSVLQRFTAQTIMYRHPVPMLGTPSMTTTAGALGGITNIGYYQDAGTPAAVTHTADAEL